MSSSARLVALALATTLTSGCSFVLTEKLEPGHPRQATPRCSGNSGPVVADSIFAGLYGFTATILAVAAASSHNDGQDGLALMSGIYGGAAALFTTSAIVGHGWVDDCRQSRVEHDDFLVEQVRAQPPAPIGPPSAVLPIGH
jgi:hypothetical protein